MKTIRIYSDESRHKNERFMLLGGVWIEEVNIKNASTQIAYLRKKSGYKNSKGQHIDFLGEFKWQKTSDKYMSVYKELVDIFFEWIDKDVARFCCMLIDKNNPNIKKFDNMDGDGYFKLLYQLYLHNSKTPAIYKIFPDSITNPTVKVNLPKLDSILDAKLREKFVPLLNPDEEMPTKGFVNNITPMNSKLTDFIQIVDVILGAIGFLQNGLFRKKGAKKAKVELMKYIFEKMALSGYIKIMGKTYYVAKSTKFNIWIFRPRGN